MERLVGDRIVLVGTAHISERSVEEVRAAIDRHAPDIVAVELDPARYKALTGQTRWRELPITRLISGNNTYFFIAQAFLAAIQRSLGMEQGVEPGAEMLAAIDVAAERGLPVALVDRDIGVTLRRAWARMGLREKARLTWNLLAAITGVYEEELEDVDIEELLKEDTLSALIEELSEIAPSIKSVLVDERDAFIAKKLLQASRDGRVLAVVGAGHISGIASALERGGPYPSYDELNALPVKRVPVGALLGWAIPLLFLAWTFYMMLTGQFMELGRGFLYWALVTGAGAAIGAAVALGHPLSIATAFSVAWFTTLSPTLAAGWFAGLVEAKMRKPTMADLEHIDSTTVRGFLGNKVVRVLMVTALANVGCTIGVVYALPHLLGAA